MMGPVSDAFNDAMFRRIFEDGPLGMAIVDPDFRLRAVNETLAALLGYSSEELAGKTFAEITHPDDIESDVRLANFVFQGTIPHYKIDKRYIRKDGQEIWGRLTACVIRDDQQRPIFGLGMVEDVTEQKRLEETLREHARQDPLTGLLNRRTVLEEMRRLIRDCQAAAVMMVDVDGMKSINDLAGHQAGDEALTAVARSLSIGDAVVGRYGGDEFVVVLPERGRRQAEAYCSSVRVALSRQPAVISSIHRTDVRVSAGIAVYPDDGADEEALIRAADRALYEQKRRIRRGGNGTGSEQRDRPTLLSRLFLGQHPDENTAELNRMAQAGRQLAIYERDTGLYAYWYLRIRGEEEIARARRYNRSVSCISLWASNRELIQRLATELSSGLRTHDLPGYLNNGHFVVLLLDTAFDGAEIVLHRLLDRYPSLTAAAAAFPDHADSFDALLEAAKARAGVSADERAA